MAFPPTADWYLRAAGELAGTSALQVAWAHGIASDAAVLALIDELPEGHRQPSLVFSAAAYCGAPTELYPEFREWLVEHWPSVCAVARERRTQTNEPGRCLPLIAALAHIPGPIALLEIGASAGLCLLPDRYAVQFDDGPVLGLGEPMLVCHTSGEGRAPTELPVIVWRRGLDVSPLSVNEADDRLWLEALLPLDRDDRRKRLRTAIATAQHDPPEVMAGDALDDLARAAADAPTDATLVVIALGTLVYLPGEVRGQILPAAHALGARVVTFEGVAVLDEVRARLEGLSAPEPTPFLLAIDGVPLAYGSPHGDRLSWLSPAGLPGG